MSIFSHSTYKIHTRNVLLFFGLMMLLSACGNDGSPDTTPPVISINGSSTIILVQGDVYTELGAAAVDDRDGAVEVTTNGTVDSSKM